MAINRQSGRSSVAAGSRLHGRSVNVATRVCQQNRSSNGEHPHSDGSHRRAEHQPDGEEHSAQGAQIEKRTKRRSRKRSSPRSRSRRYSKTDSKTDNTKLKIGDVQFAGDAQSAGDVKSVTANRSSAKKSSNSGRSATFGKSKQKRRNALQSAPVSSGQSVPVEAGTSGDPVKLDKKSLQRRRGRTRGGRPLGRYSMHVHVSDRATHIAILEGWRLIQYFVSRRSDDVNEIHGNIYLGSVQNVLPGMEVAFVDIGTPKNAVIYRKSVYQNNGQSGSDGGLNFGGHKKIGKRKNRKKNVSPSDANAVEDKRIEDILTSGQPMICQVTKNPIGTKGARLDQRISLPGRFLVLLPEASGVGVSRRLPERERKRLSSILERIKPDGYGVILRTAAENVTEAEIARDIKRLVGKWEDIAQLAKRSKPPTLLYREAEATLRLIREEMTSDYRMITIDDFSLFHEISEYVSFIMPALDGRVKYYDPRKQKLPLFERYHVSEQLVKALHPKVWLPSGGSIIIEHTEALTVIDVNTSKNVGSSNLEDTVLANNLEAAEEIARQLRLRNIGGLIVVDFVDMEIVANRDMVVKKFKEALACDKTHTPGTEHQFTGTAGNDA